jgi:hypothetical protein
MSFRQREAWTTRNLTYKTDLSTPVEMTFRLSFREQRSGTEKSHWYLLLLIDNCSLKNRSLHKVQMTSLLSFREQRSGTEKSLFYAITFLLDQKVIKKSRLTFIFSKFYFLFHYRIQTASSLDSYRFIEIEFS